MARFVVKTGPKKDMCYDESGVCAQNVDINFRFYCQHNWEGRCDRLKRKRVFTLTSYEICISTSEIP